jgi:hypothetical protein
VVVIFDIRLVGVVAFALGGLAVLFGRLLTAKAEACGVDVRVHLWQLGCVSIGCATVEL